MILRQLIKETANSLADADFRYNVVAVSLYRHVEIAVTCLHLKLVQIPSLACVDLIVPHLGLPVLCCSVLSLALHLGDLRLLCWLETASAALSPVPY